MNLEEIAKETLKRILEENSHDLTEGIATQQSYKAFMRLFNKYDSDFAAKDIAYFENKNIRIDETKHYVFIALDGNYKSINNVLRQTKKSHNIDSLQSLHKACVETGEIDQDIEGGEEWAPREYRGDYYLFVGQKKNPGWQFLPDPRIPADADDMVEIIMKKLGSQSDAVDWINLWFSTPNGGHAKDPNEFANAFRDYVNRK